MAIRHWRDIDVLNIFRAVIDNEDIIEEIEQESARLEDIADALNKEVYIPENQINLELDVHKIEYILQYESFIMSENQIMEFTLEVNRRREKRKYAQLDRYL